VTAAPTAHHRLRRLVDDFAALTRPERIEWCDGSAAEQQRLCRLLVERGTFVALDPAKRPNSFWARSDPRDVAWRQELDAIRGHYAGFGDRLPPALGEQLDQLAGRLAAGR